MKLPAAALAATTAAIGNDPQFAKIFGGPSWLTATPRVCTTTSMSAAELDATLPTLTLTLGASERISIQAGATASYLHSQPGTAGSWCSALDPVGSPSLSILPSAFMRSKVVVFDLQNKRMGFAPRACTN